jgi:general secretion pathway protein G
VASSTPHPDFRDVETFYLRQKKAEPIMKHHLRKGVSLIEMVIVILILGIIAAVAAPRMLGTATTAEQNTTRQQLAVLRNAIEMYRARSGIYPPINSLPEAMSAMLNGPFPAPSIGSARDDAAVYYDNDLDTTTAVTPDVASPGGWAYKPVNGSLKINVGVGEVGCEW